MSWKRYECPECRSRAVEKMTAGRRPAGETYPVGGEGAAQAKADSEARYRCQVCGNRSKAVIDTKHGCRAQPDTV